MRIIFGLFAATLLIFLFGAKLEAQQGPGQRNRGNNNQGNNQNNQGNNQGDEGEKEEKPFKLPDDERLVKLHETFVISAEKLAAEYEKGNHTDKARACYEEILRLVPTYKPAQEKLGNVKEKEATAEKKLFDVYANKGWQDAGIAVHAGKPINIKASGTWTMKVSYNLPPEGIEVPEELRAFPLGALVGKIADSPTDEESPVFLVGAGTSFEAEKDGRLLLRMFDADPTDNVGRISVIIEGTFKKQ